MGGPDRTRLSRPAATAARGALSAPSASGTSPSWASVGEVAPCCAIAISRAAARAARDVATFVRSIEGLRRADLRARLVTITHACVTERPPGSEPVEPAGRPVGFGSTPRSGWQPTAHERGLPHQNFPRAFPAPDPPFEGGRGEEGERGESNPHRRDHNPEARPLDQECCRVRSWPVLVCGLCAVRLENGTGGPSRYRPDLGAGIASGAGNTAASWGLRSPREDSGS